MNHIDRTIVAGAVAAQTTIKDMTTMVKMLLEREDLNMTVENVNAVINALLETKASGALKEIQGKTGPNRKERRGEDRRLRGTKPDGPKVGYEE